MSGVVLSPAMKEALLNSPAMSAPLGVKANFVNPPNQMHVWEPIFAVSLLVSIVALRMGTKLFIIKKLLLEDYMIFGAFILAVASQPLVFMTVLFPIGVHQWNLKIRQTNRYTELLFYCTIMYSLVMMALKAGLVLQIQRMFVPRYERGTILFWLAQISLWTNIVFYLVFVLFWLCSCRPIAKSWDVTITTGYCVENRYLMHPISAGINAASDILLLLLPQPSIYRLQIKESKKWGLRLVSLVGLFACTASILRLYYAVRLYQSPDRTYYAGLMERWAVPEFVSGFMSACLPVLPRFVMYLRGRAMPFHKSSSERRDRSGGFGGKSRFPSFDSMASKWSSRKGSIKSATGDGSTSTDSHQTSKLASGIRRTKIVDVEFAELISTQGMIVGDGDDGRRSQKDVPLGSSQDAMDVDARKWPRNVI